MGKREKTREMATKNDRSKSDRLSLQAEGYPKSRSLKPKRVCAHVGCQMDMTC